MNLVEIYSTQKGKTVYSKNCPSKFDELTRAQFLRIAPILFTEKDKWQASSKVIHGLLNKPIMSLKLTFGELFYLADFVQFIFVESPSTQKFFIKNSVCGLVPLRGPQDNFNNLTAWQFGSAEMVFEALVKHPENMELMGRFAACLLLPIWQKKFDDSKVIKHGKRLQKLPPAFLQALFFNYMLVRSALAKQYPSVFTGETKKKKKKKKADFGWAGIIQKLPGDLFGTLDKRADEPLHNVLAHLEISAQEAEELEAELSKKK